MDATIATRALSRRQFIVTGLTAARGFAIVRAPLKQTHVVVTFLPVTSPTATEHDRTASLSTCTVQAPHCAMPQPNLVPVRPSSSRSAHKSGASGSISS